MLPDIIDNTNFRYLKVNNKYIQSICIKALPENIYFLDVIKELPNNINYDLSMFISKLDSIKAINNITFNIGLAQGELDTINRNQRNIDIITKSKEDAALLRKKLQIENQEMYNLSIIISFYSDEIKELNKIVSSIKAKFYSKGISSEITNFRHLELYLSNLPLDIKKEEYMNKLCITTDALSNIFPFYTSNFIDNQGVIMGYTTQNRLCILDIFSNKYENSNMCIFGCSGSGKSFFTKLFIIRNYFFNKKQIILDIENEYGHMVSTLNGQVLFDDTYVNILEITKDDLERDNYLEYKIDNVISFISIFYNIDKEYFKTELFKLYNKYKINSNVDSVVIKEENNELLLDYKIRNKESFPTIIDLAENMKNEEQKRLLENAIMCELKYFSKITNIDTESYLHVLSMKDIIKYPKLVCIILQYILDNCLEKDESIIYIDEMWRYSTNEEILGVIFSMYKTIRKKRASIISITQDISDFFEYKNGAYANSILNNSCFKMFFKTNFDNLKNVLSNLNIDYEKISLLKKGESVLLIDKNNIKLKIKANEFEREILNEDDYCNK